MARIRSIHPGMASDEAYMALSITAKAAWPLLWTECDDHGIFEWKPIVLKARIFPADNVDFSAVLDELDEQGCLKSFELNGKRFGIVRNFGRFQRPKSPSYRYDFPPHLAEYAGFKPEDFPRTTPGLPQDYPRTTEKVPQMKEEGGRREEKEDRPRERAAVTDYDVLSRKLFSAAGANVDRTSAALEVLRPIEDLISLGCDLDRHILPTIKSAVPKLRTPLRTWAATWLRNEILQAKAHDPVKTQPGEPRVDFGGGVLWPEATVRAQVGHWARDPTTWPRDRIGPPPGDPGCLVPSHLLPDRSQAA